MWRNSLIDPSAFFYVALGWELRSLSLARHAAPGSGRAWRVHVRSTGLLILQYTLGYKTYDIDVISLFRSFFGFSQAAV